MVNQQYVKLGAIGLCIAAITIGVGMGVSTRNKNRAAINVAKSTSTDSDLPWCPDETRRKLIVPGTETIYSANENLRSRTVTVRNLGLTFQPDTPTPTTYMPTNADDFFNPPKATPFPTNAPSSAKPSAAITVSVEFLCNCKNPSYDI